MGDLKLLHIGCGTHYHEGFINTDIEGSHARKVDRYLDISKPWPFPDNSIDGIVSMVVFQCLNWIDIVFALKEAHRVLKKGGVIRTGLVLVEKTNRPFRNFLYGKNINLFSYDLFENILKRTDFKDIYLSPWRKSIIPEFNEVDCRHHRGTLYIEASK